MTLQNPAIIFMFTTIQSHQHDVYTLYMDFNSGQEWYSEEYPLQELAEVMAQVLSKLWQLSVHQF